MGATAAAARAAEARATTAVSVHGHFMGEELIWRHYDSVNTGFLVHSDNDPRWLTKRPVPTAKADWRWYRKRHEERLQLQSVCAIAKWCQQADALRRLPALRGLAEVVLLHGGAHAAALIEAECSVRKTLVRVLMWTGTISS